MKVTIRIISLLAILFTASRIDCTASDLAYGPYTVGFESYKTYDVSRSYMLGDDTIPRPLLIHFWYPSQEKKGGQSLNFKHYIDLIAQREDYNKSRSEIDTNSFYYIKGYSDYAKKNFGLDTSITVRQILESPVSAKGGLPLPLNDPELPLLIYAPSNGKVSVQNHLICEYLASHGFMILSVASAGPNSINRENMEESTIAQVMDMEFILNYAEDSLYIQYSSLGLFGFSTGGNGIALFQMRNKKVNAVLSMDGSQEYSYYMKLYKMKEMDLGKMDLPYLSMVNKNEDYSIYPYYNSISSIEKHIFRMPYLNHFGFVSNWRFFESCSDEPILSNISISYDYMSMCALGFFNKYLKSDPSLFDNKFLAHHGEEYIQPVVLDFTAANKLCNTLLDNNLDLASRLIEDHKSELFKGENQLNLLARMFNNNDMSLWLYQKSIEYKPDSWETHYSLGYIYKEKGETLLAKNELLKAKELDPENTRITNLLNDIKPYKVLKGHKHKVQNAFFSPDGNYIISHGWDNTVKLWDVETFSEIRTFSGHTDQVWCAAMSPDNKYIASGSMDRSFILWDVETGEKKQEIQLSPYNVMVKGMLPELDREIPNSIFKVSFSPNGKHMAIASADKMVRIWDLENDMFTDTLDGQHITNTMKCYYSPNGKYLISRSPGSFRETGVIVIWETDTYTQINRIELSGSMLFSKHNELGIYAGNSHMNYYNLSDGRLAFQKPFPDFKGTLELSPDGKYMVSCNEDSYIILRNVKTQEEVWRYKNAKLEIHQAHFSPDGKYLIAGRPQSDILIWTMESLIE